MFRLLPTTKCKRQQIAILIISFFAYVAGIRNEGNNMLLEQQPVLQQQQQLSTTIQNSNYQSPITTDIKQSKFSDFRPSQQIIDFTPEDVVVPQQYKPSYIESSQQSGLNSIAAFYNHQNPYNNNNNNNNVPQKQATENENDNRRYTIEKAEVTYGNIVGEKQFSFSNKQQLQQQQIPQHLTDKPIYIYRDPYTNENYHYTSGASTEANNVKDITSTYSHNNYNNNNNGYKQQQDNDNNQEYLVQSSMIVGSHQQQQQQQQQQQLQQQPNPFRPYMSLSDDKDVYLKRPGLVYDEKLGYTHPNSVTDKNSQEAIKKISYDSHDYPPPSYAQQETSNFLPTPPPSQPPSVRPVLRPTSPPSLPLRLEFRPTIPTKPSVFAAAPPRQQYLQSSQNTLPNYANSNDNYLFNKQPTSDYYREEVPPPHYLQQQQQSTQYESRPPASYEYDTRPQSLPPHSYQQQQYENQPPPSFEYSTRPQSPPPSYQPNRPPPSYDYDARPPPQQYEQYTSQPPSYNPANTNYPQYETSRPPPGRPSYNNYYDYQIGEVPPPEQNAQQFNYPYPRPPTSQYPYQGPYRPPPPPPQQPPTQQSGFATLAQYAPQFTSLLLGGVGGGGSNSNNPLGSLIGALTGVQQSPSSAGNFNRRPVNSQLIRALENIARNDDLQCVPKVVCQMIAGQTQRGQLPEFITSPAITNFLAGFPASSPALIYGRAALLGLSGGDKICHQTYVKCPKNEIEIIYYLNNHRGGFFKLFSEPEEQQQAVNHDSTQQGATSLFSILAALTGTPTVTTTTPRPTPQPTEPLADITSGIGNFFTQLLSDYMGGARVEYQRSFNARTKRSLDDKIKFEDDSEEDQEGGDVFKFKDFSKSKQNDTFKFKDEDYESNDDSQQQQDNGDNDDDEDFHDEEDSEDTQQSVGFQDEDYSNDTQGRILQKPAQRGKRINFFPEIRETSEDTDKEEELKKIIKKFNDFHRIRKLRFPSNPEEREYEGAETIRQGKFVEQDLPSEQHNYGPDYNNYVENSYDDFQKESKQIKFIDDDKSENGHENPAQSLYSYYMHKPREQKSQLVFPQREGKILNHPYYAATYLHDYLQHEQLPLQYETQKQEEAKFVIPNNSQRPIRYTEFPPSSPSASVYNTHISSVQNQNSFSSKTQHNIYVASPSPSISNTNSNNNHFLPTPAPTDIDDNDSNFIYPNNNFVESGQHHYNSLKQNSYYKPPKYPSYTSPFNSDSNNNFYKPPRYSTSSYNPGSRPQPNYNRYQYTTTTTRPYTRATTEKSEDNKNIYVTNSRGVTEYYIRPDGRKVYL